MARARYYDFRLVVTRARWMRLTSLHASCSSKRHPFRYTRQRCYISSISKRTPNTSHLHFYRKRKFFVKCRHCNMLTYHVLKYPILFFSNNTFIGTINGQARSRNTALYFTRPEVRTFHCSNQYAFYMHTHYRLEDRIHPSSF